MKKIITASLVAMMAVTAAHADIASTTYVDSRTGDVAGSTFVNTLEEGKKNLSGAVDALAGKLSSGNLTIANGAVGTDQLANEAVTSAKIANGTIVDADIADDANIAQKKIAGLGDALNGKVDKNQGAANEGKGLVVDAQGAVALVDVATQAELGDAVSDLEGQIEGISGGVGTQLSSLQTLIETNKTAADTGIQEAKDAAASALADAKTYTNEKDAAMAQRVTAIEGSDYAKSGITLTKVNAYDAHVANGDIHVTTTDKTNWNAKQSALNTTQMAAVNSGVTETKVTAYDAHVANEVIHVTAADKTNWNAKVATAQGSGNKDKAMITDESGNVKPGQIVSGMIADGTVAEVDIAANAVTTEKIADGNVTSAKLASGVQTSLGKADTAVQRTQVGIAESFGISDACKQKDVICSLTVKGTGTGAVAQWEVVAK